MTREIKFRAWDKDKKRMFDSGASKVESVGFNYPWGFFTGNNDIEIMQYTGLQDRNGKEIYESDLLTFGDKKRYTVDWFSGGFVYRVLEKDDEWAYAEKNDPREPIGKIPNGLVEIIGNIYENPELLQ